MISRKFEQAVGLVDTHIDHEGLSVPIHCDVVDPFRRLQASAAVHGFDLVIASGFRSFERQLAIWNGKACGQRPLLDCHGQPLDVAGLSDEQILFSILRWSALPGASRHHWGTDVDVYDRAAVPPEYRVQLTPEEYADGGFFSALTDWLTTEGLQKHGFFRPYGRDAGGVAPEPWHLSYAPLAAKFAVLLKEKSLKSLIERTDIQLKDALLDNFHHIYHSYVIPPCL